MAHGSHKGDEWIGKLLIFGFLFIYVVFPLLIIKLIVDIVKAVTKPKCPALNADRQAWNQYNIAHSKWKRRIGWIRL